MLQLERVAKTYLKGSTRVTALAPIDVTVRAGEFVAVQGPSGSGKTTCLLIAGGLLRPDSGKALIDGCDLYSMTRNQLAAFRSQHIGFVFQQYHLIPYLSVLENILAPEAVRRRSDSQERAGIRNSGQAPVFGGNDPPSEQIQSKTGACPWNSGAMQGRGRALAEQFGLKHRLDHTPGELSSGEKQRTALARALLFQPKVLLADEITGNLDHANAQIVLGYLREYVGTGGSILLVTHDHEIASQADRVECLPDPKGK
jgi:putative ABC transport system ATP-binding protein